MKFLMAIYQHMSALVLKDVQSRLCVCFISTLLGTQFLENRHTFLWYASDHANVCTQPTNMRLYATTLKLLTYLVTLWKRSFITRIFSKQSWPRSTITATLQPEKNICTSIEKGEQHVTRHRYRSLEILFLTGKVPSQNTGAEINYLVWGSPWISHSLLENSRQYFSIPFPLHYAVTNHSTLTHWKTLTLSLLMSYTYGAPCKARNVNVVYIPT
jgi:hypothetical protein